MTYFGNMREISQKAAQRILVELSTSTGTKDDKQKTLEELLFNLLMQTRHVRHDSDGNINEVSIIWSADDVLERVKGASPAEAGVVLARLAKGHDANYGISWETIDAIASHLNLA